MGIDRTDSLANCLCSSVPPSRDLVCHREHSNDFIALFLPQLRELCVLSSATELHPLPNTREEYCMIGNADNTELVQCTRTLNFNNLHGKEKQFQKKMSFTLLCALSSMLQFCETRMHYSTTHTEVGCMAKVNSLTNM